MHWAECQEGDFHMEGNPDMVMTTGTNHAIDTGHKVDIHIAGTPEPQFIPVFTGDVTIEGRSLIT